MYIIVFGFIVIVAIYMYFLYRYREKQLIRRLSKEFGKKPKNINEEFEMDYVKNFYEIRKEHEETKESIDEITWNDLDMNSVFKRINYTNTTMGEAYLYYKLREVNYDKDKWNRIERLIKVFLSNDKLRTDIQMKLMKVGKLNNYNVFNFIYNPKFNKIPGLYIYIIMVICFISSIILCFFSPSSGILLTAFLFTTNMITYLRVKNVLKDNIDVMIYLLNNINICQKFSRISENDFAEFRNVIKDKLKKCRNLNKIKRYSFSLNRNRDGSALDIDLFIQYIKMVFMADILAYEGIMKIFDKNKESFVELYDLVAEIDFALSIACYRKSLEEYCEPKFIESDDIEMKDVYHPLINDPVKNSICIKNNIIFTGSNASGKSTFIKSIALNCILAQSLNTALCSEYKCKLSKVITSMAVKDNVMTGESYFISEIKSLKRLLDSLSGKTRVIAFIDEILKGTNTMERISASAAIMKYGQSTNAKILVATHDMELTSILDKYYENYHFEEKVNDEGVFFDYKLKKGPSTSSNAIRLLKTMNYEQEIVDDANEIYKDFVTNKKWKRL